MGAVFALFAAWYFWIPKMIGVVYEFKLAKMHFWALFVGVNVKGKMVFDSIGKRFVSNNSNNPENNKDPFQHNNFELNFDNIESNKRNISKNLKNKAGVYLFRNKITNDFYVGSSITLSKRMAVHFYNASSKKDTNIILYRAMKKYELKNFSLHIIKFCFPDVFICSDLEQKWINKFKPRYNTLKIAGSSSGFRHSIETINKLKELFKKENHPKYGSVSSPETRQAISEGIKNFYRAHSHPSKGLKGKLSPQYGIGGQFVFLYNKTGKELIFPSINGARQHFKVRWTTIKNNLDKGNWVTLQGEEWVIQSVPRQK